MLAVDWGTSSLRIYRLDDGGGVRERRESGNGILNVRNDAFARTLENEAGDWLDAGEAPGAQPRQTFDSGDDWADPLIAGRVIVPFGERRRSS